MDLDLPPEERFQKAYFPYKKGIQEVVGIVKQFFGAFGDLPVEIVEFVMEAAHAHLFPATYKAEIEVTSVVLGLLSLP